MKLPHIAPAAERLRNEAGRHGAAPAGQIQMQGCNAFEWIGCAAAVAGCAGLSGPALVGCVAAVAPGCIKCVS